ncbi:response regulator transcription factor [Pantanalinema rosaneae CENA516]|uniref:response regulator transcription factor n=1 Tax=Pantanalinema rosaneae TaxID=1620701 RepID=UPI003D6E879B
MTQILVIEDEVTIQENTQEVLEAYGFEVITADNGAIGVQLARSQVPDLILCDIMMPELDGYGVLAALRQDAVTEMIPIIFLTAKASRADQRQGMNLGADDYLTKPFTAEELLGAISSRLERQTRLTQKYIDERQRTRQLKQESLQHQQKLQASQQLESLKTELLQKLSRDLRDPLSSINMAIHLLRQAKSETEREQYLEILQKECAREIQLLNEIANLQELLTPENTQLLQRFKLLNH